MEALKMTQGATVVVSAVILGLQLSFQPTTGFGSLIAISIVVQMLFQPWFSDAVSSLLSVSAENRQILVLTSAMSAAILDPVFAARYDCAAKTATLLTLRNDAKAQRTSGSRCAFASLHGTSLVLCLTGGLNWVIYMLPVMSKLLP